MVSNSMSMNEIRQVDMSEPSKRITLILGQVGNSLGK